VLAVVVAAIVVVVCSAAVGQGLCALSGRGEWAWWSPGVGFAAVVTLTGVLVRIPGHSKSAAAGVALATLVALAFPSVRRALLHALPDGIPVALIALLASLIPFLVWRRTGILGEGVNNDSGAHLGTAWWLQHQRGPAPVGALGGGLAVVGYPLGPHGLIDAIALGRISLEHAFDGMLIAIAPLTALVGLGGLPNARRPARWVAAVLVGLAYLAVSFEMQASFKETIEALLVVTTALCARDVARTGGRRAVIPLGIAIAGSVYIYSYGGLVWQIGRASCRERV